MDRRKGHEANAAGTGDLIVRDTSACYSVIDSLAGRRALSRTIRTTRSHMRLDWPQQVARCQE